MNPIPVPAAARRRSLACGLLALAPLALAAQTAPSLTDLSLEQLSSIEVTSVGKRVQRLADVPGSVYVINQEDIRRSGAVTLPEVLRLAPNLHVARADANQYAISARGFNSVLANKMLVLVDGRTMYSPLFSGVFWESLDLVLEDIERIEVLSGAGGTLYGSNAVNGVINIVTRNAAETTGTLLKSGAGNRENLLAGRWGGSPHPDVHWRFYAKRLNMDETHNAAGAPIRDSSQRNAAGFRADHARGKDQWTLQGDVYQAELTQGPTERRISGTSLLGRWARDIAPGERAQLQAYFDRANRDQPGSVDDRLDTIDIEFQHTSRPLERHDFLWGAGYRRQEDSLRNLAPAQLQLLPNHRRMNLWNVFAQDEFALTPDIRFTAGLKAEHNSYTGLEWLPNARVAWQATPQSLLWAAVSRAVRVPSRVDRDAFTPQLNLGGPNFDSEIARVAEIGWRSQPSAAVSYSVTLFHHDFDRLRSVDTQPGGLGFGNSYEGQLTGVEAWGRWKVSDTLRFDAGYVHQKLKLAARAGTAPLPGGQSQLGNDPRNRVNLGLSWDVAPKLELDARLRHVGSLPLPAVPSYTALDLRVGWHVRPGLELSLTARNVGDRRHPEWGAPGSRAELERAIFLKAVWRL
ncbi:TonB-dependent receptor plug domain-containing protein [Caenimonas sedimenti]|nr:TonB-dependent receptor [Caenimonas sedimenti]